MPDITVKIAVRIILALLLVVIVGGVIVQRSCTASRGAKTEATISKGQAGASLASGADSVATVGNRMDADIQGDAITKENDDAIHSAEGAQAPVAAPVRNAGLVSLCRRAAYRSDPKCVQYAHP